MGVYEDIYARLLSEQSQLPQTMAQSANMSGNTNMLPSSPGGNTYFNGTSWVPAEAANYQAPGNYQNPTFNEPPSYQNSVDQVRSLYPGLAGSGPSAGSAPGQSVQDYYANTYAQSPSVTAPTVMSYNSGQPQNNLQNFGPATGVSVNPNAFNDNWRYYYGTDFNPAAQGMTAIPGSNGQYVTRSGGTFSQPGQTSSPSTSAEYDARLKMQQTQLQQAVTNRTPEAIAYLQHFQDNRLPLGYANPQTEVNQLLSMGLDPRGSSYLNGPGGQYFSNLGINPSGATGIVNPGQTGGGGPSVTSGQSTPDPSKPPDPPSGPPTGGPQWVQKLLDAGLSQGIPQPAIQQFILNNPNAQIAGPGDLMNWWNTQDQNAWIYGKNSQIVDGFRTGGGEPGPETVDKTKTVTSIPVTGNNQVTPVAEQLMMAVQRGQMTMAQAQTIMDNYARNNPGINIQTGVNSNQGTPPGSPPPGGSGPTGFNGSLFSGPQNNAPPPGQPPPGQKSLQSNFVNAQGAGSQMNTIMGQQSQYQPTSGYNGPANYGGMSTPQAPPPIWVGQGPDVFNTGNPQSTTPSLGTQSTLRWSAAGNGITNNRRPSWGGGGYHSRPSGSTHTTPGQDYSRYSW